MLIGNSLSEMWPWFLTDPVELGYGIIKFVFGKLVGLFKGLELALGGSVTIGSTLFCFFKYNGKQKEIKPGKIKG